MKRGSIRLRLWLAAAISIVLALAVAGVGLRYLFEQHVERRVESELGIELNQLIGSTALAGDVFQVSPLPTDPRFLAPLSGYYWQIEDLTKGTLIRSRSLWDETLTLPPEGSSGGSLHMHQIPGPGSAEIIVAERVIVDPSGRAFRAAVAEDHLSVTRSVGEYVAQLVPAILLVAFVLIVANFVQISIGLRPLERLRSAVHEVVARRRDRLEVAAPSEVQPLADEIDRLLEAQDKALLRARSRATDLAHGLKTPLQVLSGDIRALRAKGETVLADEIESSMTAIRRHVERELARARLAPDTSRHAVAAFAAVARDVVEVVRRTPRGSTLGFAVDTSESLTARIDPADLAEILGNLVENAARFASSSVRVSGTETETETTIRVTDDGPGIADADKPAALRRGVRLDAANGGTGLGLAIVTDIVEAYGGRLSLGDAGTGLEVTLVLPRR
jgi:signal transduction histidine kinase